SVPAQPDWRWAPTGRSAHVHRPLAERHGCTSTQSPTGADLAQQAFEQAVIRLNRLAPVERGAHGMATHGFEQLGMLEDLQCAVDGLAVGIDMRRIEEKTADAILDGIGQAAGAARYGQRGIALGVHLAEAAGLKTRRHEQEVAA